MQSSTPYNRSILKEAVENGYLAHVQSVLAQFPDKINDCLHTVRDVIESRVKSKINTL